MALGVYLEELTANDAWDHYLLSSQHHMSAVVSRPPLVPLGPQDPIMDPLRNLEHDPKPATPIHLVGSLPPPGSGDIISQSSDAKDVGYLHPLPGHVKDSVATPTSKASVQPVGALPLPGSGGAFPEAGGVGARQSKVKTPPSRFAYGGGGAIISTTNGNLWPGESEVTCRSAMSKRFVRGHLPSKEDYGICDMSLEVKELFNKWYDILVKENYVFDFNRELELYCVKDVENLWKAYLKFRVMLMDKAKVYPFKEACTSAGTAMLVYHLSNLKENTVGINPNGDYQCADQKLHVTVQWPCWEAHRRGVSILHVGNGHEEYARPLCNSDRTTPIKNSHHETMETRYEATRACVEKFKNAGYMVVEM
uniref:Uncharacterized protein n=1 Tax=Timema poppense TaxID=170557 RepID=A0A7R9HC86_TIMPO|nr:unnamed protein product [Timema poppensis]